MPRPTTTNPNFFGVGMSHPWFPFFQMQQMGGDMSAFAPSGDAAPPTESDGSSGGNNPAQGPARRAMTRGGQPGQQFLNNQDPNQSPPIIGQGPTGGQIFGRAGTRPGYSPGPFGPQPGMSTDKLNEQLSGWLARNFYQQPNAYNGSLTVQPGQFDQNAFNSFMTSLQGLNFAQQGGQGLQNAMGVASQIPGLVLPSWNAAQGAAQGVGSAANPFLTSGFNFANALASNSGISGTANPFINAGFGTASNLAASGGAPDITQALTDIQNRGMINIDQQLAQLREQYGGQGLGRSSDVLTALGRGASTGIADINAQQSQLAAQVLNAAADRRLGALSQLGQFGNLALGQAQGDVSARLGALGQIGQLGNLSLGQSQAGAGALLNSSGQLLQTYSNPLALYGQFSGQLPGVGATYGGIAQGAGSGFAGLSQGDFQRQALNNQSLYNEFLRMQQPQFLNAALNFGAQQGQSQGFPWGQTLGSIGSSALSILPYFYAGAF